MRRGLIMLLSLASIATAQESPIQVGSKSFTEIVCCVSVWFIV